MAEARAEQDQAAGGREARRVDLGDGKTALASIELKLLPKGRRVYAYLRFTRDGKTVNEYLGEATAIDRPTALIRGFDLARTKGLLIEGTRADDV